jgi:hypothetical protein
MSMTCPSCGNTRTFLVKTLQTHVVRVEEARADIVEESRPAVLEVLCDECDTALSIDEWDQEVKREVLLSLGAR